MAKPKTNEKRAPVRGKKAFHKKLKKAPEAPRRFKSAYIFFSIWKHKVLRDEFNKANIKVDTPKVAKMVSNAWKQISKEERVRWFEMEQKDKARFEMESSMYDGPWTVDSKSVDANAPKKPMSAFLLFSQAKRSDVKTKFPGLPASEISKILADMWREISIQEAQVYRDHEKLLRLNYKKCKDDNFLELNSKRMAREEKALDRIQQNIDNKNSNMENTSFGEGNIEQDDISSPAANAKTIEDTPSCYTRYERDSFPAAFNVSLQRNYPGIPFHRFATTNEHPVNRGLQLRNVQYPVHISRPQGQSFRYSMPSQTMAQRQQPNQTRIPSFPSLNQHGNSRQCFAFGSTTHQQEMIWKQQLMARRYSRMQHDMRKQNPAAYREHEGHNIQKLSEANEMKSTEVTSLSPTCSSRQSVTNDHPVVTTSPLISSLKDSRNMKDLTKCSAVEHEEYHGALPFPASSTQGGAKEDFSSSTMRVHASAAATRIREERESWHNCQSRYPGAQQDLGQSCAAPRKVPPTKTKEDSPLRRKAVGDSSVRTKNMNSICALFVAQVRQEQMRDSLYFNSISKE